MVWARLGVSLTCSPMLPVTTELGLGRGSLRERSVGVLVHGHGVLVSFDLPGICFILRWLEAKALDSDSVDVEHVEGCRQSIGAP